MWLRWYLGEKEGDLGKFDTRIVLPHGSAFHGRLEGHAVRVGFRLIGGEQFVRQLSRPPAARG